MRYSPLPALLLALCAAPLAAQATRPDHVRVQRDPVSLSGPRIGVTVINGPLADSLADRYGARPTLTQFGWQFETRVFQVNDGLTGMTELVGLIAGLEQGVALPSVSWLVALRSREGLELGVGPNLSPAGAALVAAAGLNLRYSGVVNLPVNVAFASGRDGTRVSLLVGLNLER